MQQIKDKHLNITVNLDRIIGQYTQHIEGPQLLVFAGIHGNEPSGIFALKNVFNKLNKDGIPIRGSLIGIAGNLPALDKSTRYCDENLNRIFLQERIEKVKNPAAPLNVEEKELKTLVDLVDKITENASDVFFVDCHSTSAQSEPYISMNAGFPETYAFVKGLPVKTVIGVEREIKGCLPEYYNKKGFHGFTFEAGQNEALATIHNQEAIIWLSLVKAGCLDPQCTAHVAQSEEILSSNVKEGPRYFSFVSSYVIQEGENFKMEPDYVNLQEVMKGQLLAHSDGKPVYAPTNGHLLMPLYQKQGRHGYFFVKEIDELHLIEDEVMQTH